MNTGGLSTGGLTVAFSGTSAGQYSTTTDNCSTASLAPGGSCTVTVSFVPGSACSPCDASLDVTGAATATASAMLTGTATGLAISPTSHDFGTHAPGTMTSRS